VQLSVFRLRKLGLLPFRWLTTLNFSVKHAENRRLQSLYSIFKNAGKVL